MTITDGQTDLCNDEDFPHIPPSDTPLDKYRVSQQCNELFFCDQSGLLQDIEYPSINYDLIKGWLKKAFTKRASIFDRFIFLWIPFNFWLSCSAEDPDGNEAQENKLISWAAKKEGLQQLFGYFLANSSYFKSIFDTFQGDWPIFQARSIKREYSHETESRSTFIIDAIKELYTKFKNPRDSSKERHAVQKRLAPTCYVDRPAAHHAPDWPHTLSAIYIVRCNLFHGWKDVRRRPDKDFVRAAFLLLAFTWVGHLLHTGVLQDRAYFKKLIEIYKNP